MIILKLHRRIRINANCNLEQTIYNIIRHEGRIKSWHLHVLKFELERGF